MESTEARTMFQTTFASAVISLKLGSLDFFLFISHAGKTLHENKRLVHEVCVCSQKWKNAHRLSHDRHMARDDDLIPQCAVHLRRFHFQGREYCDHHPE